MAENTHTQKKYDHRLRRLIQTTGDPLVALDRFAICFLKVWSELRLSNQPALMEPLEQTPYPLDLIAEGDDIPSG
ncbi:MAG: hypothetical protein ACPGLY_27110 [Rubripirellula sp.]